MLANEFIFFEAAGYWPDASLQMNSFVWVFKNFRLKCKLSYYYFLNFRDIYFQDHLTVAVASCYALNNLVCNGNTFFFFAFFLVIFCAIWYLFHLKLICRSKIVHEYLMVFYFYQHINMGSLF